MFRVSTLTFHSGMACVRAPGASSRCTRCVRLRSRCEAVPVSCRRQLNELLTASDAVASGGGDNTTLTAQQRRFTSLVTRRVREERRAGGTGAAASQAAGGQDPLQLRLVVALEGILDVMRFAVSITPF